jgi:NodT family efflux transporter outer membrane factor (OMF) lipoprotein
VKPLLRSALPRLGAVLWACCLAALPIGCAVGPDFKRPEPPNVTTYTGNADEASRQLLSGPGEPEQQFAVGQRISSEWWQLFQSAQLSEAVREAMVGSPTLAVAESTLAQAQEAIVQARAAFYPQIDANSGASRQHNANGALHGSTKNGKPQTTISLFSIGTSVSYTPDVFGETRRQVEEAEAQAQNENYQLAAAYLTLTGNVVMQAITIAGTRLEIAATEEIIDEDQKNLDLVQAKFEAGKAARTDVLVADSQLANDRALLPPLRQQLSAANHALSILIGQLPADWAPPPFELSQLTLPGDLPVQLPSEFVHQRPDIIAAEAQLHAASAAIGVATAQLYPSITLSGSIGLQSLTPETLFEGASTAWNIGAGLTAPVFHGGALLSQQRSAIDAFQGTFATYRETVLQAFGQVADTLDALAHDADLVAAQRHALDVADESLALARISYEAGKSDVLQLLDSQRLDQQARLGYARAQTQRFQDTTQLFVAMGGGWWDNPSVPRTAGIAAAASAPPRS